MDEYFVTPSLGSNGCELYHYGYFDAFKDKVFYFQADNNLSNKMLELSNWVRENEPSRKILNKLAGDISEEYSLPMDKLPEEVSDMFRHQLSKLSGKEIKSVEWHSDWWTNYVKKGEYNPTHNHKGTGLFSVCWYLDIPEEIRNEWKGQNGHTKSRGMINFQSSRTNESMMVNPKTNDVLVFYTDHLHQVYPFYSDNERISTVVNIKSVTFMDGEVLSKIND